MEKISKYFIEPAQATKACRQCNFSHGHVCFVDKMLGEKHTSGLRYGNGRCAEVLKKESPKLAFANAKALCEHVHSLVFAIKSTVGDECQRT
jgi:hypothetical protein